MSRAALLSTHDLMIGYSKPLTAALNLKIYPDDLIMIKGRNGSGKSTLIKTLSGELSPLSGKIEKSCSLQVLPQHHQGKFLLPLTVSEIAALYGVSLSASSLFPIENKRLKWTELSGGMQQRLLLELMTTHQPDLLILDEPTNHLDQAGREDFAMVIDSLFKKQRIKALLMVSHTTIDHQHPITQRIEL